MPMPTMIQPMMMAFGLPFFVMVDGKPKMPEPMVPPTTSAVKAPAPTLFLSFSLLAILLLCKTRNNRFLST